MFSYLRPRSRHGATNVPVTPEASGSSPPAPDYSSRFPPPQHNPPPPPVAQDVVKEGSPVPRISARAPILPPIPRVASIYGPPSQFLALDEQQTRTPPETYHSRVHSTDANKSTHSYESSPRSTGGSNRPSNNFSRPFHGRDTSLTPSEERMKGLQEIWRNAAQTAQSHERQLSREGKPLPFVNTNLAQQRITPGPLSNNTARTPRMPFQDEDTAVSSSTETFSPQNLSATSPYSGRLSDDGYSQAQRERSLQNKLPFARPIESQTSHSIGTSKDVISTTSNQEASAPTAMPTQTKPSRFTRLNPMSYLTRRRSSQPSSQTENVTYRRDIMLGSTLPQDYVGIRGNRVHDFSAPRPKKVVSQQTLTSVSTERSPDGTNDMLHVRTKSRDESSSLGVPSPSPERRSQSPTRPVAISSDSYEENRRNAWRQGQDEGKGKNAVPFSNDSSSASSYYSDSESDYESDVEDAPRDPLLLGDPTFGLFSAPDDGDEPQEFSFLVPEHLAGPPPPRTPRSRSRTPNYDRSPKGKPYIPASTTPRSSRSRSQTPSNNATSPKDPRAPRSASTPPLKSRTPSPQLVNRPRHSKSNASRFSFDLAGVGSSVQEKLLEDKHRQKISKDLRTSKISQMSVPETDDGFDSDDAGFDNGMEEDIPGMDVDDDDFPMANSIANSTLESTSKGKAPAPVLKPSLYNHDNVAVDVQADEIDTTNTPKPSKSFIIRSSRFNMNEMQVNPGDDFYFDDGAISDADLQTTGDFDESVFDDPSYRIGQHIQTTLPVVLEQKSQESSQASTRPMSFESNLAAGHNPQASADTSRTSMPSAPPWEKSIAKRSSMLKNDVTASKEIQANLTQDNLAAYHDALALAAQKAATDGRFERETSIDAGLPNTETIVPKLSVDVNNITGAQTNGSTSYDDFADRVIFDDYEQEDDEVIAAANADALGYDGEFYGDEFHFYSTGDGADESQYGGYFVNDIKRSHSGRANGQEPSLTPITETSEWSTRNSMVISAAERIHGGHVQQPGLAQIADSLRDSDDDMTMSSLKRLRQNAFAGSSTSLGSGSSGKNGSPPSSSSQTAPRIGAGPGKQQTERAHPLRTQALDIDNNGQGSPQLPLEMSPGIRRPYIKGHSRNSSGAESVTYVQENDAEGSRWVLERRRTTEDGSIEVLGRQVVEGGRI